jgi:2-polyprenyl-3-methyl-5-hydroxy-6-metoxy-1,4-benzoquinol methylase
VKLSSRLRSILERHPEARTRLRKVRFALWREKVALSSRLHHVGLEPDQVLGISPRRITKVVINPINWDRYVKVGAIGRIVGGDWDLHTMPFEHLNVYQAFRARFVHGASWEDTSYYQNIVARLDQGTSSPWDVRDRNDLRDRLDGLDRLFLDIKEHGYKTKTQLLGARHGVRTLDEVTVRIGRDGEFLFEDGRHRLAIAKVLDLPKIPVLVTWRHREWYQFGAQILDYAKRHYGGRVYQPITHPDLAHIPAAHGHTRYELIRSSLPLEGGTLLDIGANWGYFCHRFEDEGFQCYAVEASSREYYFLNKLRVAENRRFAAVHTSIFEFWEKSDFDVVLALNVFHHFLKTEDEYEKLVRFLRRLRTRVLFFEPHLADEAQMAEAYCNLDNEAFVRFVAENSGLGHWECIGCGIEGRPIYRLMGS